MRLSLALALLVGLTAPAAAQPERSVARQWNDALLQAIRDDFARPPVHARNLFHVAAAMYDAWAAYDAVAVPVLLGQPRGGSMCSVGAPRAPLDREADRREAISYAAYRVLTHRFLNSPGALETLPRLDALLAALGYDPGVTTTDPAAGPAGLGNAVAACVVAYGLDDGANEALGYEAVDYLPVNPPLEIARPGNPTLRDPNRWQPLRFERFIDQSGNEVPGGTPAFVGPEWGRVQPFALPAAARTDRVRDGALFSVYHDPGPPPMLDTLAWGGGSEAHLWGAEVVARWSGHLDPADGVLWDLSPATSGALNDADLPADPTAYPAYYTADGRAALGPGRAANPRTGQPYAPNPVRRGDATRVLAEYWADGPESETPPGHWFVLLNEISDDARLARRFGGTGPLLDALEWDVKAYLALGGAMHDAAIAAWGLKGWYDTIRPVSALRAMAGRGQRRAPGAPGYHPGGVAVEPGFLERIEPGDPLAGDSAQHVGAIKVWAWRGPAAVENPETDVAGVGWVRLAEWWPYQRPTFVTPPFAGYVSGHSTYSRAAAEVLGRLTGDPFFPGGLHEVEAPAGAFLVFEDGPSETVRLQWATYRDAADQSALSRIWGGIHPPADDLPGRRLGAVVGADAFEKAAALIAGTATSVAAAPYGPARLRAFPSPVAAGGELTVEGAREEVVEVFDALGRRVRSLRPDAHGRVRIATDGLTPGLYVVRSATGAARVVVSR
jgi:hypothetical protein